MQPKSNRAILKSSLLAVAALLMVAAPAGAASPSPAGATSALKRPAPKSIDYDKLTTEAADLLSGYIRVNTTNPPGNELPAAKMLREKFLAEGIPATIWEPQPGRAVIAARLHGIGKHNKSLVLLSHMDVVPADPKDWLVAPFSGEIKDGEIWGRGALDDKGPGVVMLMAMLAIKRAGILLDRDILFLATADEEEGGRNGAGWLVVHEPDVIGDAAYVLNEGGEIRADPGKPKLYRVSVSEKTPLWLRLTAHGLSGHASTPPAETAVTRLVHALNRLAEYHAPVKVLPLVQNYFHVVAQLDHGPRQLLDLRSAMRDPSFARQFLARADHNAMVRDTITPTVLSAGSKTNVISATASAELDCRILPGDDPAAILKTIRKLVSDDHIQVEELLNFPPISSPSKSSLMTAIKTLAEKRDKAEVVPTMIEGFTDSHYFRERGLVAYGFVPLESTPEEAGTIHGANERIGIANLRQGLVRMVELLEIAGGR